MEMTIAEAVEKYSDNVSHYLWHEQNGWHDFEGKGNRPSEKPYLESNIDQLAMADIGSKIELWSYHQGIWGFGWVPVIDTYTIVSQKAASRNEIEEKEQNNKPLTDKEIEQKEFRSWLKEKFNGNVPAMKKRQVANLKHEFRQSK